MSERLKSQGLTTRRLLLIVASLTLGAFGWFLLGDSDRLGAQEPLGLAVPPQASPGKNSSDQAALAHVGSQAITLEQVEARAKSRLDELDRQRQAVLDEALQQEIADRLLDQEAQRRGLTRGQLLDQEVIRKGDPSAQAERLDAFLADLRSRSDIRTAPR